MGSVIRFLVLLISCFVAFFVPSGLLQSSILAIAFILVIAAVVLPLSVFSYKLAFRFLIAPVTRRLSPHLPDSVNEVFRKLFSPPVITIGRKS